MQNPWGLTLKKLNKGPAPAILSSQKALNSLATMETKVQSSQEITRNDIDSTIYGDSTVKKQLLEDQSSLCAYCESLLLHVSSGEKDHFRPVVACCRGKNIRGASLTYHKIKPGYYWLAYDWNNLIFSCEKCNHKKSYYFPLQNNTTLSVSKNTLTNEQPLLLNPYVDDPALHLEFRQHIAFGKSAVGKASIVYYDLNREALKEKRRDRWNDYMRERLAREGLKKDPQNSCLQQIVSLYDSNPNLEYSGMISLQKK